MAVTFKIKSLAQTHGVTTAYQLQKMLNVAPPVAASLWRAEEKKSLAASTIDTICEAFNCQPADFIIYTPNKSKAKK